MKTEAIRLCIQAQYGKQDYDEAREELNTLLARIAELEAAQQSAHADGACICPPRSGGGHITWIDGECPVHGSPRR